MKKSNNIFLIILALLFGSFLMYIFLKYNPSYLGIENNQTNLIVSENVLSKGINNVYNSVVVIENYKKNKLNGIGSGFIYNADGYIMTNEHVIADGDEIKVILMDGETIKSEIIGSDEYADIAVLKIDKKYIPMFAKIGKSDELEVGDTVFAIGSPMSSNYRGTVTKGILSGKDRMVEVSVSSTTNDWIMKVMQTDAAINPGNSGGPLCNINGEVIGIASMKIVEDEIEGVGFAIPIEDAIDYAEKIVNNEKIKRSYLGISMSDISNADYYFNDRAFDSITSGVVIVSVTNNSPAYKAGTQEGDIITSIGEYKVNNVAELRYYLYKYEPNDKIKITIIREGKEKTLDIILGES